MISVIVNFFNNRREAKNTLFSMTRQYQQNIPGLPYEVICIDHGSTQPLNESEVTAFGPEFRYHYVQTTDVSPVKAINEACRSASGEVVMVMIDGAHILSPGIFLWTSAAFQLFPSPFVATVPLDLGPHLQMVSVREGYNQKVEDELVAKSKWRDDGYNLFSIASGYFVPNGGWFGLAFESSCFAIRKSAFLEMGGFHPGFQAPGGGMANLDFFQRAVANHQYVMLLGEATFHQYHGGVSTKAPVEKHPWDSFEVEYKTIRGKKFERTICRPYVMGGIPTQALALFKAAAMTSYDIWTGLR